MEPELQQLLDLILDGQADPASLGRLQQCLESDPEARSAYVDQMRLHALLQWRHGRAQAAAAQPRASRAWRGWLAAACLLLGIGLAAWYWHSAPPAVASVIETRDLRWAAGQAPREVASRVLAGTELDISSGELTLRFDSGTIVTLLGPARFQVVDGQGIRVARARAVTARMQPGTHGFTVATPAARIVDFGTEFGVDVDDSGKTQVVVFDGEVEVSHAAPSGPSRLGKGEGVEVALDGELRRVVAIEGRPGSSRWSTKMDDRPPAVIAAVRDNLRGLESTKYYRIVHGGLAEDAPAYVDRAHQWNGLGADGLPAELRGADLVMTFNEDKRCGDEMEVTVTLAQPATLYVFLDERNDVPGWLRDGFTKTDLRIGLDEGPSARESHQTSAGPGKSIDHVFTVWKLEVARPGPVTLGPLGQKRKTMYGIAATHRP